MRLKVLGCYGAKIPGYATSSFLVGDSILLDAGSVTSKLALKDQVKIRSILVTHTHIDHIKDILFLADNVNGHNSRPIVVHGSKRAIQAMKKNLLNWRIWPDFTRIPSPRKPVMRFQAIPVGNRFKVEGRNVIAFKTRHTAESVGYVVEGDRGWLLYSGDTGPNPEMWKLANRIPRLETVIVDVSFPNRMEHLARVSQHLTPKMLAEELDNLRNKKVKIFVFHVKPAYLESISRELRQLANPGVQIISPGTRIDF